MGAQDILLGRGVVTLDGNDLGNVSSLALRHETQDVPIATLDVRTIGGTFEIARRSRVYVDMTLHELTAANRAQLTALSDDPAAVPLVWNGFNRMYFDCPASIWTLTVPLFILMPVNRMALIMDTFEEGALRVVGEAMRQSGDSWYTLSAVQPEP